MASQAPPRGSGWGRVPGVGRDPLKALLLGLVAAAVIAGVLGVASAVSLVGKAFPGFLFDGTLVVSTLNPEDWPGPRAGVMPGDAVVAVRDQPVATDQQLWEAARSVPAGTPLRYRLRRDGKDLVLTVPTRRFSVRDLLLAFGPLTVIGVIYLAIGGGIFAFRPDHPAVRACLSLSLALAIWCNLGCDSDGAHWLARAWFPTYLWMAAALAHVALVFPVPTKWGQRRWARALPYLIALPIGAAWEALYRQRGVAGNATFEGYLDVTNLVLILIVLGFLAVLGTFGWRGFRTRRPHVRRQCGIAILGVVSAFLPAIAVYVVPSLMGRPISTGWQIDVVLLSFTLFPLSLVYAIVRAQLFDISVVVKRTLVFTTVTTCLAALYFAIAAVLRLGLDAVLGTHASQAENLVSTAALVLAFAPIRDRVTAVVDRMFHRGSYDLGHLVTQFTALARGSLELDALVATFTALVGEALHPRHLEVWVLEGGTWTSVRARGEATPLDSAAASDLAASGLVHLVPAAQGGADLFVPLVVNGEVLGLVRLGPRLSDLEYDPTDRRLVENLSQQLALALKSLQLVTQVAGQERVRRELEIAAEVQQGLLPKVLPELPGLGLALSTQPAHEVGGDFYDVIRVDEDRWGIVVGDVAGKGVPAALMGAVCLTIFQSVAPGNRSAADVLTQVNAVLHPRRPNAKLFVAVQYLVVDVRTRQVAIANAGLPPPWLNGEPLALRGLPLGAGPATGYRQETLTLGPEDLLLAYSDGLEDAADPSGARYGFAPLLRVMEQATSAADLHARLQAELAAFTQTARPFDDVTLLALGGALERAPTRPVRMLDVR